MGFWPRRIDPGDALGNHSARARFYGSGDKISRAFSAQPGVPTQRLCQAIRVVNQGEIRELVHHDVWLNLHHGPGQCRRVEDIHHNRLDAAALQLIATCNGTRRPKTTAPPRRSSGISRLPMAPVAPARKTRVLMNLPFLRFVLTQSQAWLLIFGLALHCQTNLRDLDMKVKKTGALLISL